MQRNINVRLLVALCLALTLSACSTSKSQNPVASGDEVGKVSDDSFSPGEEKPATYTAKKGDTLKKIAGRPEIYGDPNLWPLLQEANADKLGHSMSVNKGVVLKIPRDLSSEQIDMAHEKARQIAAANKMSEAPPKEAASAPTPMQHEVNAAAAPTPLPPLPVPPVKKSGVLLPVLSVLLLILAGLAGVLFYFMKKDKKDGQD